MGIRIQRTALDLQLNEEATIRDFSDENAACRLLTLGIIPRMRIRMVRRSPFGEAICIQLGNTYIAIRNKEAQKIILE